MAINRFQELALITRCVAADDRNAFGQLVDAYSESLRRFLLGLTKGDSALADDLAQETFLKAYLSIRSLEGVTRFRSWLFRIAYNEFVSDLRRRSRLSNTGEDIPDIADETPDETPISADNLTEAIAQLPETQRAVVQLFYYEDFPVARISLITSLPETTVRSHLFRARNRLAVILEKYRNL